MHDVNGGAELLRQEAGARKRKLGKQQRLATVGRNRRQDRAVLERYVDGICASLFSVMSLELSINGCVKLRSPAKVSGNGLRRTADVNVEHAAKDIEPGLGNLGSAGGRRAGSDPQWAERVQNQVAGRIVGAVEEDGSGCAVQCDPPELYLDLRVVGRRDRRTRSAG